MNVELKKMLKKWRIDSELTQKDAAEVFGISESAYNKKENGSSKFTVKDIKKIKEELALTDEQVVKIFLD